MPTYSAGKAGLVAYTRCAGHPAAVAAHNVRHLCLCPFGVDTPMNKTLQFVGMTKEGKNFLDGLVRALKEHGVPVWTTHNITYVTDIIIRCYSSSGCFRRDSDS
jgi:NAD(P)-dependent dehydrogenase (short-subunit alcohol dehydrogenase family)